MKFNSCINTVINNLLNDLGHYCRYLADEDQDGDIVDEKGKDRLAQTFYKSASTRKKTSPSDSNIFEMRVGALF